MGIEDFIREALDNPRDYVAYHVGRELARRHPGKTILEGEEALFDLEEYARAEQCALVHETALFNHRRTEWQGGQRSKTLRESSGAPPSLRSTMWSP